MEFQGEIRNFEVKFDLSGDLEVPAITAAIEAHQRRITEAVLEHALKICSEKNVRFFFFF